MSARRLLPTAFIVAVAVPLARAESVATVTAVRGEVSAVAAGTGEARALTAAPDTGRIAGGALGSGDEVRTGAGASATLLFPDGSLVRLEESTRLSVEERPLPGTPVPGRKTVKRTLALREGRIRCDAKPNTPVYTSIRTPLGVVGVRGTQLTVSITGGRFQVAVESGKVFVMDTPGRAVFDLGSGQTVQLEVNERQQLVGQVLADGGGSVVATIGNARVRMEGGAIIRVSGIAGERLSVTALSGNVTVSYPATGKTETVPTGQTVPVLGPDAPPGLPPVGEGAAAAGAPDRGVPATYEMPIIRDTIEGSPYK